MNEIKLYKYQNRLVKQILKRFSKGKKHLLAQSPTGSGKTVMFSYMAAKASQKNNKVLIITDRIELLTQAGGTIERFNMNPSYIKAGAKYIDNTKEVYIAMAQTLRNRVKQNMWRHFISKTIDLIIIDEAHIQEFNYLFSDGLLDEKYVIGFTATPHRTGKMTQLGLQYDEIVYGEPIRKLIKKGKLVNCDIYDCGAPDMTNVEMNRAKGDYSETSMFKKYDNAKLYKGLVKNYLKIAKGSKMIVFCCNVEHAIKTTKQLRKAGISAKFVCSKKTAPKEPRKWTQATKEIFDDKFRSFKLYEKYFYRFSGDRKKIFEEFKNREIDVLVNVDIATKGFDDPSIEVVALYRATTSETLYLQMLGRGGRIFEGKSHFTVLDFGGNKARFGPYDIDRDWSLWHDEGNPGGGVPPMKICGEDAKFNKIEGAAGVKDGCGRLILAAYKLCPFCGFKYPERDKAKEADLALAAIVDKNGVSIKNKSFKDMTIKELKTYREIKKHPMPWLWRQLWMRNKETSIEDFGTAYHWNRKTIKMAIEYCQDRLN